MVDQSPSNPPTQPPTDATTPAASPSRIDGRCDQCGYSLIGLPVIGICPECGSGFDEQSARRLKPWPNAGEICLRMGWPLAGLAFIVALGNGAPTRVSEMLMMVLGGAFALAVPVNSWWQVRSLLKRSLPERRRTRGFVFAFRSIGTTLCVILFCAMLFPFIFLVGCLVEALQGRGGDFGH